MTSGASTEANTSVGGLQIGVIALTMATAAIHLFEAIRAPEIRVLFTLNALGYLTLLGLLYLPLPVARDHRRLARWALMAYAALTIVAFIVWVVMNREPDPLGFADKVIEVALIALLAREDRRAGAAGRTAAG